MMTAARRVADDSPHLLTTSVSQAGVFSSSGTGRNQQLSKTSAATEIESSVTGPTAVVSRGMMTSLPTESAAKLDAEPLDIWRDYRHLDGTATSGWGTTTLLNQMFCRLVVELVDTAADREQMVTHRH
jgi:hypothetical protein